MSHNTATPTEAHTALTNALQHLRHAGRCAALAFRASDDHAAACAAVHGDILAAGRAVANLIDRLDGYGTPSVDDRRQAIDAAKANRPAGSAL